MTIILFESICLFSSISASPYSPNHIFHQVIAYLWGLYLPQGSIRGLIAFLLIGGFLIFVFFGHEMFIIIWMDESNKQVVKFHTDLYEKILSIFGTLTASITGFYFGGRYSQNLSDQDAEKGSSVKSGSDSGEG